MAKCDRHNPRHRNIQTSSSQVVYRVGGSKYCCSYESSLCREILLISGTPFAGVNRDYEWFYLGQMLVQEERIFVICGRN